MNGRNLKKMVTMAMLVALAIVLVSLIHFPIFPAAPFLEYDMADVPILIGTFLFGPVSGLMLTFLVAVIQGVTVSAQSGWIGILMHFCATGAFVLLTGSIYGLKPDRVGAAAGLIAGGLAMTLMMVPLNLIFTVIFMGVPREVVVSMLIPIIIPFNLIKAGGNGLITFAVFKAVARAIEIQPKAVEDAEKKRNQMHGCPGC